jgi:hypothetical protein
LFSRFALRATRTEIPRWEIVRISNLSRGAARIRTGGGGFAIHCLTTWLRRRTGRDTHRASGVHRNTHATAILPSTTGPERLLRYASRETASPSQEERSAEAAQPLQSKRSLARGPSVGVLRRRGQGWRRELPLRCFSSVFTGISAVRGSNLLTGETRIAECSGCGRSVAPPRQTERRNPRFPRPPVRPPLRRSFLWNSQGCRTFVGVCGDRHPAQDRPKHHAHSQRDSIRTEAARVDELTKIPLREARRTPSRSFDARPHSVVA